MKRFVFLITMFFMLASTALAQRVIISNSDNYNRFSNKSKIIHTRTHIHGSLQDGTTVLSGTDIHNTQGLPSSMPAFDHYWGFANNYSDTPGNGKAALNLTAHGTGNILTGPNCFGLPEGFYVTDSTSSNAFYNGYSADLNNIGTGDFTILITFRLKALTAWHVLASVGEGNQPADFSWEFVLNGSNQMSFVTPNTGGYFVSDVLSQDTEYQIVVTYIGNVMSLYANGILSKTYLPGLVPPPDSPTAKFTIGGSSVSDIYQSYGVVSNVGILKGVGWTAGQVAAAYAAWKDCRGMSARPGLAQSYYDNTGGVYVVASGGIKYSTDNGLTLGAALKDWANKSGVQCVFVSAAGDVYASPSGASLADADKGLWRSHDAGATWARVIDLSGTAGSVTIWGITEDASGNLYAGVYTGTASEARIYKSIDAGATWTSVFYDATYKHVHDVQVDLSTGYIYATLGDKGSNSIIRSIDGGQNWTHLFAAGTQMTSIVITPTARLFISDNATAFTIYRTTDDTNFPIVYQSSQQGQGFFARRDPATGYILVGSLSYGTATSGELLISKNGGVSFEVLKTLAILATGDGYGGCSNFYSSSAIVNLTHNGVTSAMFLNLVNDTYARLYPTSPTVTKTQRGITTSPSAGTVGNLATGEYAWSANSFCYRLFATDPQCSPGLWINP